MIEITKTIDGIESESIFTHARLYDDCRVPLLGCGDMATASFNFSVHRVTNPKYEAEHFSNAIEEVEKCQP